jgi:hypothetical protein
MYAEGLIVVIKHASSFQRERNGIYSSCAIGYDHAKLRNEEF